MEDFRRLATLTAGEVRFLTSNTPTDAAPIGDGAVTAAAIIKAAATRDAGGPMAAKMSDTAQAIINAGKKRRAEA